MYPHAQLYRAYRNKEVSVKIEPAIARAYYQDIGDSQRMRICGESESQIALGIRGTFGLASLCFFVALVSSFYAFGRWAFAVLPFLLFYYASLRGDASMGARTFHWPAVLWALWWGVAIGFQFEQRAKTIFFIFLPMQYVLDWIAYRSASRALAGLAFRNERAYFYLANPEDGVAAGVVVMETSTTQ